MVNIPTKCGLKDSKGYFCRWGGHGKKYYYNPSDKASKERARSKANAQGAAAHAGGYQGASDTEKSTDILDNTEIKASGSDVPNPDEPGDEADPGEETEEWRRKQKSIDIPSKLEDIKVNSYIIYKGKVSKVLKVIE